jgi:hypothetical protein
VDNERLGIVDIHGTQGFRAQLRLGLFVIGGPWQYSYAPAGTPINLDTQFSVSDGGGTIELNGTVYPVPEENSSIRVFVEAGEMPMPPRGTEPVRLSAPFIVGRTRIPSFFYVPSDSYFLSGRGTMTLDFAPDPQLGMGISRVTYDFQPVPEPASLLLLGTGVAALGAKYRRRLRSR